MARQYPSVEIDPHRVSCVGGRTIITCPDCAGNAPRNSAAICETCQGRGFNFFVCAHCNPALAEAMRESEKREEEIRKAISEAARTGHHPSSTSGMGPWRRFGDGGGGGGGGQGSGGSGSGAGGLRS